MKINHLIVNIVNMKIHILPPCLKNFLLLSFLFLLEKYITVNEYNIVDKLKMCYEDYISIFAPLLMDSIHLHTCINHIAMITSNEIKIYQRSEIGLVCSLKGYFKSWTVFICFI